ncbi:TlyA family RNA methyltransferase [Metamycoplasma buccale]|uniref:TlyA family RNA methyltransferase n=1 Tax=Metamycoplasma buccale TaxID=55602 RepID=UPI00398E7726
MKKIIDILIEKFKLENNVAESLIRAGDVLVNDEKIILPSLKFDEKNINIKLLNKKQYVSRGAFKLIAALKEFKINLQNFICLDIGSSTGGFVQVLLENGANKVYAVDVGTNQLDYKLRINEKVVVYEKTNLKNLNIDFFNEPLDLITCDVSFISLKHVFAVSQHLLESKKKIITLIKPQFEAISKYVSKGGFVDEIHHKYIIEKVISYAKKCNFNLLKISKSPILGGVSKNIEYLALFERK